MHSAQDLTSGKICVNGLMTWVAIVLWTLSILGRDLAQASREGSLRDSEPCRPRQSAKFAIGYGLPVGRVRPGPKTDKLLPNKNAPAINRGVLIIMLVLAGDHCHHGHCRNDHCRYAHCRLQVVVELELVGVGTLAHGIQIGRAHV